MKIAKGVVSFCFTVSLHVIQFFQVPKILLQQKFPLNTVAFKINRLSFLSTCKLKSSQLTTEKCKRPKKGGSSSAGKNSIPNEIYGKMSDYKE